MSALLPLFCATIWWGLFALLRTYVARKQRESGFHTGTAQISTLGIFGAVVILTVMFLYRH